VSASGDFLNARFVMAALGFLAGFLFVILGHKEDSDFLKAQGTALISGIVSFYMGRRTYRNGGDQA
jgi:hypothetical protein